MALTLEEKKAVVAEVSEVAKGAYSAVAAEYCGLTVGQLTDLRVKAREDNVYLRVVKNSLAKANRSFLKMICLFSKHPVVLVTAKQ